MSFAGKTVLITGASRGIGKAIALAFAKKNANVACLGRTDKHSNSQLLGTVHETVSEVNRLGGVGYPLIGDVTSKSDIERIVHETAKRFNSIDILVNNAGFIHFKDILKVSIEQYDQMYQTNFRASILCTQTCLPFLKNTSNPHIVCISPPLVMDPKLFSTYLGYTVTKYGTSMYVLGLAKELKPFNIAVNAVWPKSIIYTHAVKQIMGEGIKNKCRRPEIVADSITELVSQNSSECTGNLFMDEEIIHSMGITDLSSYSFSENSPVADGLYDNLKVQSSTVSLHRIENVAIGHEFKNVAGFFEKIHKQIMDGMYDNYKLLINIEVKSSDNTQYWYITTGRENKGCYLGKCNREGSLHIYIDAQDLEDVIQHKLDPNIGYLNGRIRMKGSTSQAILSYKLLNLALA